ncbi:MAG: PilW family protein [Gammaproteobacteria bacterium]|nr:PilW family protein [Gammaproteobacteria bacterium]
MRIQLHLQPCRVRHAHAASVNPTSGAHGAPYRIGNLALRQRGLSLVEMMIAITLGMILIAGVIQIFSSSKQTYRVQEAMGRLQENARFALDVLGHDLRMAGNLGCNSSVTPQNHVADLPDFGSGIAGYESNMLPAPIYADKTLKTGEVIKNTDAVLVNSTEDNFAVINAAGTSISINKNDSKIFENGDIVIISDCHNAEIVRLNAVNTSTGQITIASALSNTYRSDAQIGHLHSAIYYLATDTNTGLRNLYRRRLQEKGGTPSVVPEPLIEGIEDMQILYGEDVNGDGNTLRYVAANHADMKKVVSLRLHLLFTSLEKNLAPGPQSYWFNGAMVTQPANTTDRRLFRAFTTTVKLRNKAIQS